MRELVGTERTCPIAQLYLEFGHYPARFDIIKAQILFYHYILQQKEDSLIYKFLEAQKKCPVRGDWILNVRSNMQYINLQITELQLKEMTKGKLKILLKQRINHISYQYLLSLRGKKGSEIKYEKIQMANYLSPSDIRLSISDKKEIFAIRNKMIQIHGNFTSRNFEKNCKAGCPEIETMEHIYFCEKYKNNGEKIHYKHIYKENLENMTQVFHIMKENMKLRENIKM